MMKALILGGISSGKSQYAASLSNAIAEKVTLLATVQADQTRGTKQDRESSRAQLISEHPNSWFCVDVSIHLAEALNHLHGADVVIIDSLSMWLSNLLMTHNNALIELELARFEEAIECFPKSLIMVSNDHSMGARFLDESAMNEAVQSSVEQDFSVQSGLLNQRLAKLCDRVELVVAGLPLALKHDINV